MRFEKTIQLKDGRTCLLRSARAEDAEAVLVDWRIVHEETDNLLTYPDEKGPDLEGETQFLADKEASPCEVEICAIVDGRIVGLAGISALGTQEKMRHRAEFGISIEKAYWNQGIGRALTLACIECAGKAGYRQIELEVVADNESAYNLYRSVGYVEYGRNPRGFRSRYCGWQELILMRRELG